MRVLAPAPLSLALVLLLGGLSTAQATHIGEALESDQQTVTDTDQLLGALRQAGSLGAAAVDDPPALDELEHVGRRPPPVW